MLILAIDTSTPAVVTGLCELADRRVRVLAERVTVDGMGHAEVLTPQITACLAEAGVAPTDLAAVVVGHGPGPFTGLRVGMATAFAFAHATGVPVVGVSGLDAIAARAVRAARVPGDSRSGDQQASAALEGGELLVVTDARRREAYFAKYDATGARLDGPSVGRAAEIDTAGVAHAVGDETRLGELSGESFARDSSLVRPDPVELVEVALAEGLADSMAGAWSGNVADAPSELPTPLYLRRPDAVEPRARTISPALVGHGRPRGGPRGEGHSS